MLSDLRKRQTACAGHDPCKMVRSLLFFFPPSPVPLTAIASLRRSAQRSLQTAPARDILPFSAFFPLLPLLFTAVPKREKKWDGKYKHQTFHEPPPKFNNTSESPSATSHRPGDTQKLSCSASRPRKRTGTPCPTTSPLLPPDEPLHRTS